MNWNSWKHIVRTFSRERSYTILNIVGLSIGMACAIMLGLYLQYELSFDKHNLQHENIYRINQEIDSIDNVTLHAQTSHFLGPLLIRDYPQIESYVSFNPLSQTASMLKHQNQSYFLDDVYVADNSVFEIFSHDIIYGEPSQALTRPNTISINQTVANRLFGDENPIGKTISTGELDYQVSLVFADLPDNTHFKYSALIANQGAYAPSADALVNRRGNLWNLNAYNYVLMQDVDVDPAGPLEVFDDFFDRMMADITREGYRARFYLEPVADIHLKSVSQNDLPRGNLYYLYAFAAVAVLVLLTACFNYINLATARALNRSKEISVRKILGADRRILIAQFLSESILYSLLALVIAIAMVQLFLIGSNEINMLGREFDSGFWLDPMNFAGLILLGLVVGAVAGLYPAIYLARMESGSNYRSMGKRANSKVRSGLVFTQFTIAIAIISATLLMFLQLEFVDAQPLGFDKQNRLVLRVQGADSIEDIQTFAQQLRNNPEIKQVSLVSGNPITNRNIAALEADLDDGAVYNLEYDWIEIDEYFVDTLGLEITDGRGFETGAEAGLRQVVINEALADRVGWAEPIGKTFTIGGSDPYTVIGELRDFHYEDMHSEIEPFVFYYGVPDFEDFSQTQRASATRELIVSIEEGATVPALDVIREQWARFDPVYPLRYEFLDDMMAQLHITDNQQMNLIAIFAAFCILISCLGLYGLTAFTTSQKTKEIGIRKTLGAATYQIILMLFSNILKLLLIASCIASVAAYLGISGWLEGFYYRDDINLLAFVAASLLTIGIAFIALALQSYKTASQSPVNALKYE